MIKNEAERYWVAGLFEGEGTIPKRADGRLQVSLRMTDRDVVERFAELVDYPKERIAVVVKKKEHYADQYACRLSGAHAVDFILSIYDLMGERRKARMLDALATCCIGPDRRTKKLPTNITWHKSKKRYRFRLVRGGVTIHEWYKTLEEAIQAKERVLNE